MHEFLQFLEQAPTAWHACTHAAKTLAQLGFAELPEGEPWTLEPGNGYFVRRNSSSLCGFVVPKGAVHSLRMVGAHTDSPGLKLKP